MENREEIIKELEGLNRFGRGYDISLIADFIISREEKIRRCEFCGSNDLVCGKAWKEEREKLLADMKADRRRICGPLVGLKLENGGSSYEALCQGIEKVKRLSGLEK